MEMAQGLFCSSKKGLYPVTKLTFTGSWLGEAWCWFRRGPYTDDLPSSDGPSSLLLTIRAPSWRIFHSLVSALT